MELPELKPPTSHTVYIGLDRYSRVHQLAIDVGTETRVQVSPSQFVQHLIDHYSDIALSNWTQTVVAAHARRGNLQEEVSDPSEAV